MVNSGADAEYVPVQNESIVKGAGKIIFYGSNLGANTAAIQATVNTLTSCGACVLGGGYWCQPSSGSATCETLNTAAGCVASGSTISSTLSNCSANTTGRTNPITAAASTNCPTVISGASVSVSLTSYQYCVIPLQIANSIVTYSARNGVTAVSTGFTIFAESGTTNRQNTQIFASPATIANVGNLVIYGATGSTALAGGTTVFTLKINSPVTALTGSTQDCG